METRKIQINITSNYNFAIYQNLQFNETLKRKEFLKTPG